MKAEKDCFKGMLLVSDMDGTLLDSRDDVSAANREAISFFIDHGGLFTVATGRMAYSVEKYDLPINAPAILHNGSTIFDFQSREFLWHQGLDASARALIGDVMARFPGVGVEWVTYDRALLLDTNEHIRWHVVDLAYAPWEEFRFEDLDDIEDPCMKALLLWDPEKLLEVQEYLERRIAGENLPYQTELSFPNILEVMDRNASKAAALENVSRLASVPLANIVAVGDNHNDIGMIKAAGLGFSVANAVDALTAAADAACVANDNHAIADIVGRLRSGAVPPRG